MSPCYHSKYLLIIVTFILIWEIKSTRWLVLFSLPRVPWSGAALPTDKCHQNSQHRTDHNLLSVSDSQRQIVQPSIYLYIFPTLHLQSQSQSCSKRTSLKLYLRVELLHGWSRNVICKLLFTLPLSKLKSDAVCHRREICLYREHSDGHLFSEFTVTKSSPLHSHVVQGPPKNLQCEDENIFL